MLARCESLIVMTVSPLTHLTTHLIPFPALTERKRLFKPTIGVPDGRRKRDEINLKIRRDKKNANIRRRRMGDSTKAASGTFGQGTTATPLGLDQTEQIVQSCHVLAQQTSTEEDLLFAARYLRKTFGAKQSDTEMVEFVLQTGALPSLLNLLQLRRENSVELVAEIILTLTNMSALGNNSYLGSEMTVGAVVPFIHHDHPEVRKQTAWYLGTIATENESYRNWLIRQDVIVKGL